MYLILTAHLLSEVLKDLLVVEGIFLGEGDEHGAAVLGHGHWLGGIGRHELQRVDHQPSHGPPEQNVQVVVKYELAGTIEEVGDAADDKVLVELFSCS